MIWIVVPGRREAANPEPCDSGFTLRVPRNDGVNWRLSPRQIEDALGDDTEHHL